MLTPYDPQYPFSSPIEPPFPPLDAGMGSVTPSSDESPTTLLRIVHPSADAQWHTTNRTNRDANASSSSTTTVTVEPPPLSPHHRYTTHSNNNNNNNTSINHLTHSSSNTNNASSHHLYSDPPHWTTGGLPPSLSAAASVCGAVRSCALCGFGVAFPIRHAFTVARRLLLLLRLRLRLP